MHDLISEGQPEPPKTSKMENFTTIANDWNLLLLLTSTLGIYYFTLLLYCTLLIINLN